jgi:cyanophycin synthetase
MAMPANRRIGVVTAPGDRRDVDLHELGKLCAALDYVIVKEDRDLRGRTTGEIAGIIQQGLGAGGLASKHIETVLPEHEAITRAIEIADDNDVVVILAEKVSDVLAQVEHIATTRG